MAGVSPTDMNVSSDVQLFPLSNHCRVISMSNLIVLFSIKHVELSLNTTNNPIFTPNTKYTEKIEQKQEQKWKENQKQKNLSKKCPLGNFQMFNMFFKRKQKFMEQLQYITSYNKDNNNFKYLYVPFHFHKILVEVHKKHLVLMSSIKMRTPN